MQHITGIARYQMRFSSVEDAISLDNQVRFINVFVESMDLIKLGFSVQTLKKEGRPSYNNQLFLKIYLYGYLDGIRSSRKLEKECFLKHRNAMAFRGYSSQLSCPEIGLHKCVKI